MMRVATPRGFLILVPDVRHANHVEARVHVDHYYLPGDLEAQIDGFIGHYNHQRYHGSLKNLTPADVYFGRGQTILLKRERIKRKTFKQRRLQHAKAAA